MRISFSCFFHHLSILFFLLQSSVCLAIERNVKINHLTIQDGLSHYTVNVIYQDELGFMWFGTMDGLNRYDGRQIEIFKPSNRDSTSIVENNIRDICGDGKGHLYVKGLYSVSEFDMRTSSFTMIKSDQVRHICHDGHSLWIATSKAVHRMEPDRSLRRVFSFARMQMSDVQIDCFMIAKNGDICISTEKNGYYRINTNGNIVQHIEMGTVNSIFEDRNGNIWVASRKEGLYFIPPTGNMRQYVAYGNNENTLSHNNVRELCEDLDGNIWLSTYKGLDKLDVSANRFQHYNHIPILESFMKPSITAMFCDRQGILWLGSFYDGVYHFCPAIDSYVYYLPAGVSYRGEISPIINSIAEDPFGSVWIATDGGGLYRMDSENKNLKTYTKEEGLSSNDVKSVFYDPEYDAVYVGCLYSGINKLDRETGRIVNYGAKMRGENIFVDNILTIEKFGRDSLILATAAGIVVFDQRSGDKSILDVGLNKTYKAQVWDLEVDGDDVWFTTSTNLYCYNVPSRASRYYSFNDISGVRGNYSLKSILKDHVGRLWFGSTGAGVFRYDKETGQFENVLTSDMLGNGYVAGMIEDPMTHDIYVATNSGISRYNPDTGACVTFDQSNGLSLSFINENSIFITSNRELIASDMSGIVLVDCDRLRKRNQPYNVFISALQVDNHRVYPTPAVQKGILQEDILFQRRIILQPENATIGFEISNLDFLNNGRNARVEYQLEGFDDRFIRTTTDKTVTYTNLNPGKYTFVVRGLVPDDKGCVPETRLEIRMLPHFYETAFFLILCLIIILIIVVYIVRSYTSSIWMRTMLEAEKREKNYIREVNLEKLRFFTNISHEFRTPLTLIDGQLELMLQRSDLKPPIYSQILNISRNSRRLRSLVDEIIDIRKQEVGKMKLKISETDIISFIQEMYYSFAGYACKKKIAFQLDLQIEHKILPFDAVQMEKVLFNLLSNAFKFTDQGGTIILKVEDQTDGIQISVADTGAGIRPEYLPHVFDRFFQDEQLNSKVEGSGSGIGLSLTKYIVEMHGGSISVESTLCQGSIFSVKLYCHPDFRCEVVRVASDESVLALRRYLKEPHQNRMVEQDGPIGDVKILIVEDNPDVRDLLRQVFSPLYEVFLAESGDQGLEMAIATEPDIVLSDIMMPGGISGLEMCAKLKNNVQTSHIPVVLITARTSENHIIEGFNSGADDYITKPFNVRLLVARCNNLINSRRRLQETFKTHPDASIAMLATNAKDQKLLEKALDIVKSHICDPNFNVEIFAREIGLSRTYMFTKIKGLTGQSPNEFIASVRLKESVAYMVNHPDANVTDVAFALGFGSTSYFIKCFKEMYGVTPNKYRQGKK